MPTHAHVAPRLLRVPLPLPRIRRVSLTLLLSTLLLAALLLTAAGPHTATTDAASYSAGGAMVATEKWTYRGTGHPKPCVAWTEADGTVRSRVYAKTGFTFRRIPQVGTRAAPRTPATASSPRRSSARRCWSRASPRAR